MTSLSLTSELRCAKFTMLSPTTISKLAVVTITKPDTFDSLGEPVHGGLYDPRMGPTERNQGQCITCGMDSLRCPGHVGVVQLILPVLSPTTFAQLVLLLRAKCSSCHRLRISKETRLWLTTRIKLIKAGLVVTAQELKSEIESICLAAAPKTSTSSAQLLHISTTMLMERVFGVTDGGTNDDDGGGGVTLKVSKGEPIKDREARIRVLLNRRMAEADEALREANEQARAMERNIDLLHSRRSHATSNHETTAMRDARREASDEALDSARKAAICPLCKAKKGKIVKAGYSKIFLVGERSIHGGDGVDDMADEEEAEFGDEEGGAAKGATVRSYLAPIEIQRQMRILWEKDGELLNQIWDNEQHADAFFISALAVPPNRFRPARANADSSSAVKMENAQTLLVQKIIQCHDRLMAHHKEDRAKADDEQQQQDPSSLARLTFDWTALQEAVNVYVDSNKAATMEQKKTVVGIRQVLEKKEGLLRQNLMGKRVNFAARSVISPDPYLSTDEVGVPIRFAKMLSYPQPVFANNMDVMCDAVRNGARKWPGATAVEMPDGQVIDLYRKSASQRRVLAQRIADDRNAGSMEDAKTRASRLRQLNTDHNNEADTHGRLRTEVNAVLSKHAPYKVHRHLQDGDVLLLNRQPTLHKASIMAHKARIIEREEEQTIRIHYANCNSYNADFDGDEINMHFPQSEMARAEGYGIAQTAHQYVGVKDGAPLRGLIQDHISMGVLLTKPNTFFTKQEFVQFVFSALDTKFGGLNDVAFVFPPPAVMHKNGKMLWTGKQVVSCVLERVLWLHVKTRVTSGSNAQRHQYVAFNLGPMPNKVPIAAWLPQNKAKDVHFSDSYVLVRGGELLTGVLDKSQFGASSKFGLVHSVYEIYGAECAADLLSALGRLFTYCEQTWGFTCGIDDLLLTRDAEINRTSLIAERVHMAIDKTSTEFVAAVVGSNHSQEKKNGTTHQVEKVRKELWSKVTQSIDPKKSEEDLDRFAQNFNKDFLTDVIKQGIPLKPFPFNNFSLMVNSGAKGSGVNQSQISSSLGQQSLEGRRPPRTPLGKTMPCFPPYDPRPIAGGYVSSRFGTGLKPSEYFFHCMSGREGLLDTAVKTARSGYLQRCLIKHLECVKVEYDGTVRQEEGSVVQFLYGGDGLDGLTTPFLTSGSRQQLYFLDDNLPSLALFLGKPSVWESISHPQQLHDVVDLAGKVTREALQNLHTAAGAAAELLFSSGKIPVWSTHRHGLAREKGWIVQRRSNGQFKVEYEVDGAMDKNVPAHALCVRFPDPVTSVLRPFSHFGSVPEKFYKTIIEYEATRKQTHDDNDETFRKLLFLKYQKGLAAPGEPVGVLAGQAIGEPATQMTLNTFHLAGHAAANITLGVPRLRELLLTASKTIKTPTITVTCEDLIAAKKLARSLQNVTLNEVILCDEGGVLVKEMLVRTLPGRQPVLGLDAKQAVAGGSVESAEWSRRYVIRLNFYSLADIRDEFDLTLDDLGQCVAGDFAKALKREIAKAFKRANATLSMAKADKTAGGASGKGDGDGDGDGESPTRQRTDDDDDDRNSGDGDEEDLGLSGKGRGRIAIDRYDEEEDEDENDDDDEDEDDGKEQQQRVDGDGNDHEPSHHHRRATTSATTTTTTKRIFSLYDNHPAWFLRAIGEANEANPFIELDVEFPMSSPRVLMLELSLAAAAKTMLKTSPNIKFTRILTEENKKPQVLVLGNNFPLVWRNAGLPSYDLNHLDTNDVATVLNTYGVEAARALLTKQVFATFAPYGIQVQDRHVGLIADLMTSQGGFRAMNRQGIQFSTSPLLRSSFETATKFIVEAALCGEMDTLESPAARIATGQLIAQGTGAFDLVWEAE